MIRVSIATMLCLSLTLVGCDDEEAVEQESTEPIVGVLELPIAYRFQPAAPANAIAIEVAPANLRVDGHTIVELANSKLPEGAVAGDSITELTHAIDSGPARSAATLRLLGSTPWRTTMLILNTLKKSGINTLAFMVRQGTSTEPGYLVIDAYEVREESDEYHEPPATHLLSWSEMPGAWQDMYSACREGPYVDCAFKPESIAEGGKMHMTLFARGNGVKVDLNRFGAPDPEPTAPAEPSSSTASPPSPAQKRSLCLPR